MGEDESKLDKRKVIVILLFIIAFPFLSIAAGKLLPPSEIEVVSGTPGPGLIGSLRGTLSDTLKPDESILWVGRPEPGRQIAANWFVIPFSIVWTSTSFFILFGDILLSPRKPDPARRFRWFFAVFFVPAGVFACISPFFTYWGDVETIYVVTDKHVFQVVRGKPKILTAFNWRAFGPIKLKKYTEDRSDIMFAREYSDDKKANIGFYGIEQGECVNDILEKYLSLRTKEDLDPEEDFDTRPPPID